MVINRSYKRKYSGQERNRDVWTLKDLKTVRDAEREKWINIYYFLAIDFIQIVFVSLMYLDSTTLFIVGIDITRTNAFVSTSLILGIITIQIIVLYYTALVTLRKDDMIKIYPKYIGREWKCKHSRENIVKWTLDIANKSNVTIDKIYLLHSPIPNAFTFTLPFVGSIVVLHSNLIDLLNAEEVQAIIAHELAHIKHYDSLVQIGVRMPDFFVQTIYLYVYFRIVLGIVDALLVTFNVIAVIARALIFVAFFTLSSVMIMLSKRYIQSASRSAEHLADYHAAKILGETAAVNALLRLGQRVEAIITLTEEIKWLASLNRTGIMPLTNQEINYAIKSLSSIEMDERVIRKNAARIFLENRLRLLKDIYELSISDEQITSIIIPAAEKLARIRGRKSIEQKDTIDWRLADIDRNERLDAEELSKLVKVLRDNPTKLMFDNEVGKNLMLSDHPDFRRRILFIADTMNI